MASSPGPRPAATAAPWSAAVPDEKATACRAPVASTSPASKAGTRGPVVSQSERRAAATASTSASLICWWAYGRKVARTGSPPSMARVEVRAVVMAGVSGYRKAECQAIGHPFACAGEPLVQRDFRPPAEDLGGPTGIAAQHGDLALGMDVRDVDDPSRVGLDPRRQLVDRDVLTRAGIED